MIFKGKIDKKYIPFVLSQGNLNILNTNHTKVLKYGCSQNKLFEYAASGKPILSNCKMGYDLILRYKCGIVEENESPEQYARNILYFYEQKESNKYEDMCKNARKLAEDYEFEKLTDKLIEVIKSCLSAER